MKVLVTGGYGLVGSAIQKMQKNFPHHFIFLSSQDCDLSKYEETFYMFQTYKPDYVIHLAARVGGLFKNMDEKVEMFETNMFINMNVLKCCHHFKVKKCINCLSTCIFPDKTTYPINEEMLHNGPPHHSNDCYAYAKRMMQVQSQAYNMQYGDNFVCVIPSNIYGPNDNFKLDDAHVIPSLIHKCYLAKQADADFVVMGSGKPLRQFTYSEDIAYLMLFILDRYDEKDSIIISVSEEISIGEVASLIAKEFNYVNRMVFDTTKSDGQYKKTADTSKLNQYIDYKYKSIQEGIQETVKWFISNYATARK